MPAEAKPAAMAPSSIGPLRRVSRPMITRPPEGTSRAAVARARESASSAVTCSFARPRTPSVPNRIVIEVPPSAGTTLRQY